MSNTMFNSNDDDMDVFAEAFGSSDSDTTPEVSETPGVSNSVSIPTEDSPLPPQDEENGEDAGEDTGDEDEENVTEVSVRFVFPNRKNPVPEQEKKFIVKLEVPIAHDLAEKTAKRITSLTRAELRGLRDIVKDSESYKDADDEGKKAMISTVKVKASAVLAKFLGIASLADKLTNFAVEAQDMTFETTATERTGMSLKKAREQAKQAYLGMVSALVQMGLPAGPLSAHLKRFNITSEEQSVQDALYSALIHEDFGAKSIADALDYMAEFRTAIGQEGNYTPPADTEE